ncbi:MAG: hypothetical protein JXR86_17610 [Spirochaetales bacterium]|nr:hypothetical protein [Spirochaetales bacterium]
METALEDKDLITSVICTAEGCEEISVFFEFTFLWNLQGSLKDDGDRIQAVTEAGSTDFYFSGMKKADLNVPCATPFQSFSLGETVYLSTGKNRSPEECRKILNRQKVKVENESDRFGSLSECYRGMDTVMAWDTIYEPSKNRVISPVSRYWNAEMHGGWVLFVWDTFFAGSMASVSSKELAYSNTVEIIKEILPEGYIGIMNCPINKGTDRSQPPVGSLSVMGLYNRFREKWLLEEVFDDLLTWNRWWPEHRSVGEGLLAWGYNEGYTSENPNYESGLDNSPLYDNVPFNSTTLLMELADVGLISLYATDCRLLARMAEILGRSDEQRELLNRAGIYEMGLQSLWNEEKGIYLNKNMRTGQFSERLAPTLLYPLLTEAPDEKQARRLVDEHLMNDEEFKGEFMIPSISRNDPAYGDQDYWRGRIWGPMNWLVYLALKKRGFEDEAAFLSGKSKELFLKEWLEKGHVHENYNGETGTGCSEADASNDGGSDPFYHWGALLALIPLVEKGYVPFDPWDKVL